MNRLYSVNEIYGFRLGNRPLLTGANGSQLGIMGSLNYLCGIGISFDGYEIKTENATYRILIENGQNCCESWGYFSSDIVFLGFFPLIPLAMLSISETVI